MIRNTRNESQWNYVVKSRSKHAKGVSRRKSSIVMIVVVGRKALAREQQQRCCVSQLKAVFFLRIFNVSQESLMLHAGAAAGVDLEKCARAESR